MKQKMLTVVVGLDDDSWQRLHTMEEQMEAHLRQVDLYTCGSCYPLWFGEKRDSKSRGMCNIWTIFKLRIRVTGSKKKSYVAPLFESF